MKTVVMLVDNEVSFVETMTKRLTKREMSVFSANSGAEALAKLAEDDHVHVVVLDIKMPGMDGLETLREIKKAHPLIEVILLTGHATIESGIEGMKLGAFDYLMKPCDIEVLIEKVNKAKSKKAKIVCGVTGSQHSQKAALEAAVMANKSHAGLIFVYAVDVSFLRRGSGSMTSGAVADSLDRLGAQILDIAEEIAKTQGVTPKKILRKGPVLEVLKQVVQEEKADLLILGHEERTFFEKALFKGTVEDHVEELKKQTGAEVTVIR